MKSDKEYSSESLENYEVSVNKPFLFLDIFFSKTEKNNSDISPEYSILIQKIRWLIWILIGFFLIFTALWKITEKFPEYQLKTMIEQGNYKKCLDTAVNTENSNLHNFAVEAFLKDILCNWTAKLSKGFFSDARMIITNYEKSDNPEILKTLEVLKWITDLEEYFFKRKPETPVFIFQDEFKIESFLTFWKRNRKEIHTVLNKITSFSYTGTWEKDSDMPGLTSHRIYSYVNMLQTQKYLYLGEIEDLKNIIKKNLDTDQPYENLTAIEGFRHKFPGVGGTDKLLQDSSNYLLVYDAVKFKKKSELLKILRKTEFHTKIFAEKAEILLANGKFMKDQTDTEELEILLSKLRNSKRS